MKILIVEDNPFDADLTSRKIKEKISGCAVDVATTLKEAEKLIDNHYDIALLDYQLPDGFGIDIIPSLIHFDEQTVIIMLTGSGNEEVAVAALQAGADDYMVKKEGYLDRVADKVFYHLGKTVAEKSRRVKTVWVLYVEHQQSDIDLTLLHFKRYAPNFNFTMVARGSEAIKKLSENKATEPFDVLLMDYKLPGLDALEVTKIVRQELKIDIAIVIITGQGSDEIAIQALKLGANEYLVKRENYLYRLPSLLMGAYQKVELNRQSKIISESEEMFRGIFENHAAIKLIVNPKDGKILKANKTAANFYGFSLHDLKKATFFDLCILPRKEIIKLLKKAKATTKLQFEIKQKNTKGNVIDVLVFSGNVFVNNDEYLHLIVYDISRRKKIEKQLNLLNIAIVQSPIIFLITDNKGIIEYINPYFTEITGYTKKEVYGKKPNILNSGTHNKTFFEHLWKTVLSGKIWKGEIKNKKKNGEFYWENAIIAPILDEDNKITHFIGVMEDVTESKKILSDLILAKEKAEESDRLKSAFLANMSHEIRTPMNGILGFTSLLSEPHLSDEKKDKYIQIIHKSGERLLNTVNDIVEVSKIEAGMISITHSFINVIEITEEILNFFQPQAHSKGLILNFETGIKDKNILISTDKNKLESILTNLIKNAIKYTDTGKIMVSCQLKNAFIEFCVEDTGIGIPANRQNAIFNRFEQADIEDTRALEGSGLGLAISKSYVELLGGKISVESELDKGSKFTFTIPFTNTTS